jgi:hypothetical protein
MRHNAFCKFVTELLSFPSSAASAEGNWSEQDFVISERRTRLGNDRATKLISVRWNSKAQCPGKPVCFGI